MQLTIPGKLDVMGAALPGLPLVNIGFNRHLAWTHTVDTSTHFTLYRLQLDPKDPTHYLQDGKSIPMARQTVSVTVKATDGTLSQIERQVYSSRFGPVVQWPGRLDWDTQAAYSLRDANLDNTRVLQQWYRINRADSLAALKGSVEQLQGIPWVNTLAVDAAGKALYLNQSVVPFVDQQLLSACSNPAAQGPLVVLDGSRSSASGRSMRRPRSLASSGANATEPGAQRLCAELQRPGLDGQPGPAVNRLLAVDQPQRPATGHARAVRPRAPARQRQAGRRRLAAHGAR